MASNYNPNPYNVPNPVSHPVTTPGTSFGVITLDGVAYIERPQVFAHQITITEAFQEFDSVPLTMPATANFLLKALTRDIVSKNMQGVIGSYDRRFRFKLSNSQASTWFYSGGLGILNDQVVDTVCFGNAQFPFLLVPPIPVPANGSLFFDVADMGIAFDPNYYPYTVYFGFQGSYLIPVQSPSMTSATGGTTAGG